MDLKKQLTKTPIMIFFILLGAVGMGTASALVTITLAGDVDISGDTTLHGDLICTECIDDTNISGGAVGSSEIQDGSITTTDISTSFMKFIRFADDVTGFAAGWNPNGATTEFTITDSDIIHTGSKMSVVAISLHDNSASPVCSVKTIDSGGEFRVKCTIAPAEGAILGYVLMTPP